MIRILRAARMESWNGKKLDLELLLNQIKGIFKPDEEAQEEDCSLHRLWPAPAKPPRAFRS